MASMGHVRDLPKSKLGVDVDEGFEPTYEVIASRKKVLKELKDAAKDADDDLPRDRPRPRRRGDRLAPRRGARQRQQEEDPPPDVQRDHQEGRARGARASDGHRREDGRRAAGAPRARPPGRLQDQPAALGQGRRGLCAGRVQSVALKLVCDREREIEAFVPEEYWNITARLAGPVPPEFDAQAPQEGTAPTSRSATRRKPNAVLADLKQAQLGRQLGHHEGAQEERGAALHHEQAAAGVALPGQEDDDDRAAALRGIELPATAPSASSPTCAPTRRACRTRRSPRCASTSPATYGADYVPEKPNFYKTKTDAQDAHEAIRPTSLQYRPRVGARASDARPVLPLQLIWNRFVASQMPPAIFDDTTVDITAAAYLFRVKGSVPKFAGWLARLRAGEPTSEREGRARRTPVRTPKTRRTTTIRACCRRSPRATARRCRSSKPSRSSRSRRRATAKRRWSRRWRRTASAARAPTPRSSA